MPALGGLRLQVRSEDLGRAREVLDRLDLDDGDPVPAPAEDPEEAAHLASSSRRKRFVGLVAFLIFFLPALVALILSWLS